ncbi:hypothetical protein AVEN_127063-1 [Araneus ventricosus]|uniref:Uncharacterized protein n=1 Tax=Araneus ventricosus TaxID=182803 RepID=A0A4Y2I2I0_ARAVE|nr:hypothetical protein AVEN_127063-1 [Araneus ventricosus]
MSDYINHHNTIPNTELPYDFLKGGIDVYAPPNPSHYQTYAKDRRGERYAKDEHGNEYTNEHAYARLYAKGQYYPRLENGKEVYSYFGNDRQKYAKDTYRNQFYAQSEDGREYCAHFQTQPRVLHYYAKDSDDVERYPCEGSVEKASTGEYRRAKNREEYYPRIVYE